MIKSIANSLILLFSILNFSNSYAYSNYDECNILWDKIKTEFPRLSLDEPHLTSENRFGIFISYNEDGTKQITSIHQDLAEEIFFNYEQSDLHFSYITEINGKDVSSLSDEAFDSEFEGSQIDLKVSDYANSFQLIKKEYESIVLDDVILNLHDVSSINTKSSQFDANFTIHTMWRDYRYFKIAKEIFSNRPSDENVGFFCKFDIEDVDKQKLFYPKIVPQRFITKRDDIYRTLEFHFEPNAEYYCENSKLNDRCSLSELKNGLVYFELKENYLGTINDQFPVKNFPFDTQLLRFNLHPDRGHNFYYQTELNTDELSVSYYDNAVNSLYSPEWEFKNWFISNNYELDPASLQFFSTLNFDYEIERKNLYYVFKLMLPVIFLIVLSGMVFFIRIEDLQSRLTISIVCFLSLIAYIFVVDDELPKLGYLTFIDVFILLSYMFSGLPTLQTVFIEQIRIKKKSYISSTIDMIFRRYYFVAYIFSLLALMNAYDLGILRND